MTGALPRATKDALRAAVVAHGFNGVQPRARGRRPGLHAAAADADQRGAGQGHRRPVGRGLASGRAAEARHAEQIRDYLVPSCLGKPPRLRGHHRARCGIGHQPRQTTAMRRGDRYVIDGEKWFVTSGDEADYVIVHALVDGDPAKPTLFLVDRDAPGLAHQARAEVHAHLRLRSSRVPVRRGRGRRRPRARRHRPGARAHQGLVRRGAPADRRQLPRRRDSRLRARQRLGRRGACSSACRSAITRRSNSCWPTWRSRSWRRRA